MIVPPPKPEKGGTRENTLLLEPKSVWIGAEEKKEMYPDQMFQTYKKLRMLIS